MEDRLSKDEPKRKLGCIGSTLAGLGTLYCGVLIERFSEGVRHWVRDIVHQRDSFDLGISVLWALMLSLVVAYFAGKMDDVSSALSRNARTFLFVTGVVLAGIFFKTNC
jgi:hypothetical protein